MDNFFDDLKNNLNERPEPEFEESAWLSMQEKMRPEKERKKLLNGWWLGLLLLPMMLACGYFYFQLEKAETTINEMKVQVYRDTIYTTRTIYVRDTIYQSESFVNSHSSNNSSNVYYSNSLASFSQNHFSNTPIQNNTFTNNFIFDKSNSFNHQVSNLQYPSLLLASKNTYLDESNLENKNASFPSNINLEVALISSLENGFVKSNQQLPIEMNLEEAFIFKKNNWRKKWFQITNTMRPKSFRLGIGGGYIYPTNENLSERKGYTLNLQGVIGFNKNLRMWMDFSYLQLHLQSDNLDKEFGIPDIPLPNADYTFEKATTDQPLFQYSVGMQYLFNTNKKLHPYFGAGLSIVSPQSYEVEYEYEDLAENEIIIPKDYSNQGVRANHWILNVGVEYQFRGKWSGQLEGFYRAGWERENNVTPNILGLNTRLMYKF